MVRWIRYKHRIPAPDFQRPGERSVRQVADELGVSRNVVYYWIFALVSIASLKVTL